MDNVQVILDFVSVEKKLPLNPSSNKPFADCLVIAYPGKIYQAVFQAKKQAWWCPQYKRYLKGVLYWTRIHDQLTNKECSDRYKIFEELRVSFYEENDQEQDGVDVLPRMTIDQIESMFVKRKRVSFEELKRAADKIRTKKKN